MEFATIGVILYCEIVLNKYFRVSVQIITPISLDLDPKNLGHNKPLAMEGNGAFTYTLF